MEYDLGAGRARAKRRVPRSRALNAARKVIRHIKHRLERYEIAGSIRRGLPEAGDAEIVALPDDTMALTLLTEEMGFTGGDYIRRGVVDGVKVEIYVAHDPKEFGSLLLYATGDWQFNIAMRSIAKRKGWRLTQHGLFDEEGNVILQSENEEDFFDALGVRYHAPAERSFELRKGKKRATMEAEELIELGAAGKEMYPNAGWDLEEWREPDIRAGNTLIWYGPEGPEGDVATEMEIESDGYVFCEYQGVEGLIENPPSPILKTCVRVDAELLARAFAERMPGEVSKEDIEENPEKFALWAASVGSIQLSYYGGEEEWVEELPR